MRFVLSASIAGVLLLVVLGSVAGDRYQDNIFFNYYNSSGSLVHIYNLAEGNTYEYDKDCHPGTKFAIVVFGWKISCDKYFVQDLIGSKFRVGLEPWKMRIVCENGNARFCSRSHQTPGRLRDVHELRSLRSATRLQPFEA